MVWWYGVVWVVLAVWVLWGGLVGGMGWSEVGGESAGQHPPEPGNRFVSFVRACARLDAIVNLTPKVARCPFIFYLFGTGGRILLDVI